VQQECDAIGPISLGEAAITGGGQLLARYVIHAASMHLGGLTSEGSLRDTTVNSLKRAVEKKLQAIAFPAIGTGVAGFPLDRCAQVMLEEVRKHLSGPTTLERILFILFDEPALKAFQQAFAAMPE
jgi:O-acetyl-ADP-ribose deacetylase (regulator of RNase III)